MDKNTLITEDNLIGSIASAMLKLKTLNHKKENIKDLQHFIELIKFIENANETDYKKLLYDKNFFIAESVLNNIHNEFRTNDFSSKIDFPSLTRLITNNIEHYVPVEVEETLNKLKEIMLVLINSKAKNQVYL